MEEKTLRITDYFGANLATLLADKIIEVYPQFKTSSFISEVKSYCEDLTLTQRVELIADQLKEFLPNDYRKAIQILTKIMGPENPHETGMFTNYYWLMPVGKFIEKYGLEHFKVSMQAIEQHTKRNTGEYAVRPFVRKYPEQVLQQMKTWAQSENFHLRRLASEGLRPKLPWASKLDLFIDKPSPVFEILELLKADPIKFVKKSVANHLTDYIKVNPEAAFRLIDSWKESDNIHTLWIVKHATRKLN
jgi:3-methyladenine DNA glycosylase AlkC